MLIRIWSLSVALVVVSGLISGLMAPASYADDTEESMESIWADESHDAPAKTKHDAKPTAEVKANANPIIERKAIIEQITAPVTSTPVISVPVTNTPVSSAPVSTPEKAVITTPLTPANEVKAPELPPAIFMRSGKSPQEMAETTVQTKPVEIVPQTTTIQTSQINQPVQPNIQGDLSETAATKPAATTAAPLSKLDDFNSSHFIKQGGWPGIGPFHRQPGSEDTFVDDAGNNLDLHISGGRISQATFNLINKSATYDDFLDLQVASEFLLEGLNVKPKTIMEFNQQLEDAKDNLLNQSGSSPITINAGRYIATVNRQASPQGEGRFSYVVSVVSKDASPDVIKEHSKEKENQGQKGGAFSFLNKQTPKTAPEFIIRQNQEGEITPPKATSNNLTETFSKTIQSWQDIKKVAVRQRKTEELNQILAGKALIRQTDAIKWLSTNHKYYDMNPKGISIERFNELNPGQKYAVFVEIKEVSKLMDDATSQVIKEQDDSYKVNYTVEKINGHWYITDSAIVDKSSTPSAPHTAGKSGR